MKSICPPPSPPHIGQLTAIMTANGFLSCLQYLDPICCGQRSLVTTTCVPPAQHTLLHMFHSFIPTAFISTHLLFFFPLCLCLFCLWPDFISYATEIFGPVGRCDAQRTIPSPPLDCSVFLTALARPPCQPPFLIRHPFTREKNGILARNASSRANANLPARA